MNRGSNRQLRLGWSRTFAMICRRDEDQRLIPDDIDSDLPDWMWG